MRLRMKILSLFLFSLIILTGVYGTTSNYPEMWDWRDRHGENWISPLVEDNNTGQCFYFSAIAAMESQINLYFNRHVDLNLSEQFLAYANTLDYENTTKYPELVSGCCVNNSCEHDQLCKGALLGVPDEECAPFEDKSGPPAGWTSISDGVAAGKICADWENKSWRFNATSNLTSKVMQGLPGDCPEQALLYGNITKDNVKEALMKYGPMSTFIAGHSTLAVGYIDNETTQDSEEDIYIIVKNSWPAQFEALYYDLSLQQIFFRAIVGKPVPPNESSTVNLSSLAINCTDKDDDRYCNWGISEDMPDTCDSLCRPEKDCDDSNASLGPFDEYYNCLHNNPNKFIVQNSSGHNVAWFGDSGDIVLKGTCTSGGSCDTLTHSSLTFKSGDDIVAYIDFVTGNLCIETGDCSYQTETCTAPDGSFIIKDKDDNTMIYIDATGDLCLTGTLTENGDP